MAGKVGAPVLPKWASGRTGACNLIEGRAYELERFLDELSYGEKTPPEVFAMRAEWRRKNREREERRAANRARKQNR
jgi:hypothetical protein